MAIIGIEFCDAAGTVVAAPSFSGCNLALDAARAIAGNYLRQRAGCTARILFADGTSVAV